MNTLNNQQINPGNRVDFSRMRRFAKGGVPKYQEAPGPLEYDWDPFYGQFSNNPLATMNSKTSLPWNRTWAPNTTYNTVQDLENSQNYKDFTNYVLNNSTNEQVMQYLKHLDTQARRSGTNEGVLFTDASQTTLRDGWDNEYTRLRNDGKYGYFHLNPEFKQTPPPPTTIPPPENQPVSTQLPQDFNTLQFLPERQKGVPNLGYLHQIYGNNIDSINKQLRTSWEKQAPKLMSEWHNAKTTSGFLEQSQLSQQLENERERQFQALGNTGSADKVAEGMQNFQSSYGLPMQNQITQIGSNHAQTSGQTVNNVMNQNRSNSIQTANTNIQAGVADYNSKLNASIGAEAQKAAEYASLVNNRNTKLEEFTRSEKLNEREYNKKINAIMATAEGQQAYKTYVNSANDAANIADSSSGVTMQDIRNSLMETPDLFGLTDEDLDVLNDPMSEKADVIDIIRQHAAELQDAGPVQEWLAAYNGYMKDADDRWLAAKQDIANKQAILELGYDPYISGTRDGAGTGTNWQKLYGSSLYAKKGGKMNDRWSKYLSYRAKMEDTIQRAHNNTQKLAHDKLTRDLDALDRETLLLLRSIFK